jgi:hypothetical protein
VRSGLFNILKLKKTTILVFLSILSIPVLSILTTTNSYNFTLAQTDECSVEIEGGPPDSPLKMYPGELAEFRARMTGGNDNANYTWTVEGPIIKKYDNQAYNATNLTNPLGIDDPTPMSPNDFQNVNISFYWQPNTTDTNRTVTIHVQTVNGEMCDDSKNFVISRSSDDIDLQAEDFYVETKQSFGNRNISSPVLLEHQSWHINNSANGENYNYPYIVLTKILKMNLTRTQSFLLYF